MITNNRNKKKLILINQFDKNNPFSSITILLKLTTEQEKIIDSQSILANKLYNILIEETAKDYQNYCDEIKNTTNPEHWKTLIHPINSYNIRNKVPKIKEKNPELKSVYSDILKNIGFSIADSWKSYIKLKKINSDAKPPTFRSWKEKFCNLTYLYDKSMAPQSNGFHYNNTTKSFTIKLGYKLLEDNIAKEKLTLIIPAKHLFLKKYNHLLKQITISKKDGKYYIFAVFNLEQENYENKYNVKSEAKLASLDLNHKNLAHVTTSSGKSYEILPPTKLKWFQKQIREIEKRQKCKENKNSRSFMKLEKAKQKLIYKKREQMKHFIGFASNTLIKENDNIVVGDYIPSPTTIRNINHSIINNSNLGQFRSKLQYKCIRFAKGFEVVDENNTTRECSYCNHNNGKIEVNVREFVCSNCGRKISRDENSSFNIMKKSYLYESLKSKHKLPLSISNFQDRGYSLRFNNRGYEVIKYREKCLKNKTGNVSCLELIPNKSSECNSEEIVVENCVNL